MARPADGQPVTKAAPAPNAARFDWLTYEGRDSVFDRFVPKANEYRNPILTGFHPDPSIVRKGNDYYLVASSFTYFPGVPIFRSTDLVHWTQIGNVLDRPSQLSVDSAGISRGIFAPTIREHAGTFYLITTVADRGNFLVTATNPAGPWSDPVWLPELNGTDGFDPSLFFDDDGRAYVVNNGPPAGPPKYSGHRAIWIQEYDVAARQMIGPRKIVVDGGVDLARKPVWIEAPHIFKRYGKYYLTAAEGGTADQHSQVIFRSDAPMGPYAPGPINPILTQRHLDPKRPFPITSTGHADFVDLPNGETWAVFLGTRPYGDNLYNTGRETFLLPVRWEHEWPIILGGTATVPWTPRRPPLPDAPAATRPTTGNFAVREDFAARTLGPEWITPRTPRAPFYDLKTTPGWLTLTPGAVKLGSPKHLAFVGRRQQHTNATVATAMRWTPRAPGDEAGLVAMMHDDFNYFLGVALVNGRPVVELVQRAGAATARDGTVLASAPLPVAPDGTVYLKIAARAGQYDFFYGTRPGVWTALKTNADGTILSSKVAGGFASNFVGVVFGLYAYSAAR